MTEISCVHTGREAGDTTKIRADVEADSVVDDRSCGHKGRGEDEDEDVVA